MAVLDGFLQRLKQRKRVQWVLACAAGAFAPLRGIDAGTCEFGARRIGREWLVRIPCGR